MYSDKIKAIKSSIDTERKIQSRSKTEAMIREFCTRDDAIGAPCKKLLDLFDQFCKDYGYPLISRNHTGIVLRDMYGLARKSARIDGKITWIYIEK